MEEMCNLGSLKYDLTEFLVIITKLSVNVSKFSKVTKF